MKCKIKNNQKTQISQNICFVINEAKIVENQGWVIRRLNRYVTLE